jgi:hypothetical protein
VDHVPGDGVRRVGVSAFGFGGTNFHMPCWKNTFLTAERKRQARSVAVLATPPSAKEFPCKLAMLFLLPSLLRLQPLLLLRNKAPLRGALVIGAASEAALIERLRAVKKSAQAGLAPAAAAPAESDLRAPSVWPLTTPTPTIWQPSAASRSKRSRRTRQRFWKAAARSRNFPRTRSGAQGRVPVYRARLAVREHAARHSRR